MEQIIEIGRFILKSFIHIWPYLAITIPLAVVIRFLNFSKYINSTLNHSPYVSILLATIVGAFSPFCSCGVIPVIASLLIGGVPVAPIMSFWLASPSMDPEIFFLSVSTLGWKLAIWRLASTFLLSLGGGLVTYYLVKRGWLKEVIKDQNPSILMGFKLFLEKLKMYILGAKYGRQKVKILTITSMDKSNNLNLSVDCGCSCNQETTGSVNETKTKPTSCCSQELKSKLELNLKNIGLEIYKAVFMVTKFMGIAFLINAAIEFYVPKDFMTRVITTNEIGSIFIFSIFGVPFYASNISALPLVQGLLSLGLHPGAALAFLISGPTTTLPAMAAVYGISSRKVFFLYISIILVGSISFGLLYFLFG